ncbi:MAG: SDR family oxidoreductase [Chloroflexi bacterium AL-W]|nr:SDR family oxidoreductase [Chloroflexi bacterium AL-N1]NOK70427.1 SDR family oxidoreductase [Chloroflexi bacterium AL-N10]NOK78214.1 SDR family oxidoreductase [Chloroflexi bacterium AL-N5]NOK85313.1 SDR family oxidoreductase [Chloroflexi bacterium AL-W]NOK92078.1 SDR family oxidoreductase [Chloroflexi bacterium AL-N15]
MPQIAIVTGANRGIGLEICRQLAEQGYTVLLGARDLSKGEQAANSLAQSGLDVQPRQLDVANPQSITNLSEAVNAEFGQLDVLVNNAAIHYDTWQQALTADLGVVQEALETNTFGAWRMVQAFIPLLRKSPHGRIVNVSSEGGSLASMGGGTPAYSVSKTALNALTRMLAAELRSERILVNSICPGWVATDMGGASAPRSPAEGARGIVGAATLPDDGPTGGFFRDGRSLPW